MDQHDFLHKPPSARRDREFRFDLHGGRTGHGSHRGDYGQRRQSTTLAGATVRISGNYQSGEDLLSFTNTPTSRASWNAATGTLTLSGVDTLADYQAALRAVTYVDTSPNPSSATRTVSFQVNDGLPQATS